MVAAADWRVLLVDDDPRRLTKRGDQLLLDGYELSVAGSRRATELKLAEQPDAMILCKLGNGPQTLGLLRELRRGEISGADSRLSVMTIGASTDSQAISHLKAGSDMVLPATASPPLISAGLEALRARCSGEMVNRVVRFGQLTVDLDARAASFGGQALALTRLEFDLLATLARAPTRVHNRSELTEAVWGYDPSAAGSSTTIRSHQSRLRRKLAEAGAEGLVENIRGVGVRLSP
jgi:DNA-binding response OmpR family regulator